MGGEPTCHAEVAVARSLALSKAATPWNQLLLLLLRYLIPKVVKHPPNIHHAGVEAVDGPRFNQKQRPVRSGEKWHVFIQLHMFLAAGKCGINENNIIYITQLHTSEISCFVKFKA